jgi:hypothetical protein
MVTINYPRVDQPPTLPAVLSKEWRYDGRIWDHMAMASWNPAENSVSQRTTEMSGVGPKAGRTQTEHDESAFGWIATKAFLPGLLKLARHGLAKSPAAIRVKLRH